MMQSCRMTFDGALLSRGFWLYVWEIRGRGSGACAPTDIE